MISLCERGEASARSFRDSMARSESEEDTQRVRIVEARVNHLIQDRDATKLQVDFGHDETALIEHWQVLAARGLKQEGPAKWEQGRPCAGRSNCLLRMPLPATTD